MPELVADCPRCDARHVTFDVLSAFDYKTTWGWQKWYEAFCRCRHCARATIFVLSERDDADHKHIETVGLLKLKGSLNSYFSVQGPITLRDNATIPPPEHVPEEIQRLFEEGATCLVVGCYSAAGTMFRLCVDLATRSLLPGEDVGGLNRKIRRDLGLRLPWLFKNGHLPRELEELSSCIKEGVNEEAHAGTLEKADAEDLLDFTVRLLDRVYSEPERLRLAEERRQSRRSPKDSQA